MKNLFLLITGIFVIISCKEPRPLSSTNPVDWDKRTVKKEITDSLSYGSTFLSVYSQIYVRNQEEQESLTATVSLHNPNRKYEIFIDKAVYYNTHGDPIRTYFDKTISIKPMETVQIVIDGIDSEGGTGANFLFDWKKKIKSNDPIFEAVMITNYGQQGISFVTNGRNIN